jgi:hypothetical protein
MYCKFSRTANSCSNPFTRYIALKCDNCVNTGESAAVFGFPLKKAIKIHPRVETAAAGLLFIQIPNKFTTEFTGRRQTTEDGRQKTEDGRRKTVASAKKKNGTFKV